MSSMREPNPLRPYYTAPFIGEPATGFRSSPSASAGPHINTGNGSTSHNILPDIDYGSYISGSSPATVDALKNILEQATWKYTSVLMAQPFEVAKILLQIQFQRSRDETLVRRSAQADTEEGQRTHAEQFPLGELDSSDDSDFDSPGYFSSSAPLHDTPSRQSQSQIRRRRHQRQPRGFTKPGSGSYASKPPIYQHTSPSQHLLDLPTNSSVLQTITSLWNVEGAWGIWKGTNCSFVYSILFSTITSFIRSVFAALLALPDPGMSFDNASLLGPTAATGSLDVTSSISPLASLAVAIGAAGLSGIILAPLDLARIRLILTPITHPPRSIIASLRSIPSWTLPLTLLPATILHSVIPTAVAASTPLLLRSSFNIDSVLTPTLYSVATFTSQVTELCIRWPIETVLRRNQAAYLTRPHPHTSARLDLILQPGPSSGLLGTMIQIVHEEGDRTPSAAKASLVSKRKKGQGVEGLYRGWRIGMWGIVGIWGASLIGGTGTQGGEF